MKNFIQITYKESSTSIKVDKKLIKIAEELDFFLERISIGTSQLNIRITGSIKSILSTYIENQIAIEKLKKNKKIAKIYKQENKVILKNLKSVSKRLSKMNKKSVDLSQFDFLDKNLKLLDKVNKGEEI